MRRPGSRLAFLSHEVERRNLKDWILHISFFIIAITILVFFLVLIFRYVWRKQTKTRALTINLSLTIFSILYLLIIVEIVFASFFIQSDGGNNTLVAKRWHEKYWQPINSDGYRDYEHSSWQERVLFVLGDSFIAGHGIKNIEDRLANVLAEKLGSKWTVAVLAKNGWGTTAEFNALINHNKKPNRIIVSYYINDIVGAAKKRGYKRTHRSINPHKSIKPLVDNSYLFNWFYWNLSKTYSVHSSGRYLERAYRDPNIWKDHAQELQKIINYAKVIDAKITFIIWPKLTDIGSSVEITAKVTDFLEQQQVTVINLSDNFAGRSPEDLVINAWDGHPNVAVNAEVSGLLYTSLSPWVNH